jgi:hypothetical protein
MNGKDCFPGRPHPVLMASQARHESVSLKETSASRYVVPQEKGKPSPIAGDLTDRRAHPFAGFLDHVAPMELQGILTLVL